MNENIFILFSMLVIIGVASTQHARATDMQFSGALVAKPCVIKPGSENVLLDFGTISDKYLYQNFRTNNKSLMISLVNCTPSVGQSVSLMINGAESKELNGFLAIDSNSTANGIAIGLEMVTGSPLKINTISEKTRLVNGDNDIPLRAYVQIEPSALAQKSVGYGTFNTTATVSLTYD